MIKFNNTIINFTHMIKNQQFYHQSQTYIFYNKIMKNPFKFMNKQ